MNLGVLIRSIEDSYTGYLITSVTLRGADQKHSASQSPGSTTLAPMVMSVFAAPRMTSPGSLSAILALLQLTRWLLDRW